MFTLFRTFSMVFSNTELVKVFLSLFFCLLPEFCVHSDIRVRFHPTVLVELHHLVNLLEFHPLLKIKLQIYAVNAVHNFFLSCSVKTSSFFILLQPQLMYHAFLVIGHPSVLDSFFFLGQVDIHCGLCAALPDTSDPHRKSKLFAFKKSLLTTKIPPRVPSSVNRCMSTSFSSSNTIPGF